ncbi:DUF4328 domain-containing protein [Nonomuraea sp. NPDC059194]|uniref:DUF4328 domain-containing protein n=1 Tax=Nonomuraea sp. NPDC059194 TaxID=3346764 RepID=UPI003678A323
MTALVIFDQVRGRQLAAEIVTLGGDARSPGAEAVVGAVTLFAVLMMLAVGTLAASASAYLTWLVRARRANKTASPSGPVLAAWLLPGVNLVAPVVLVDQVWRQARPPYDRRVRWLALVAAWWASWLAALALVAVRLPLRGSSGELTGLSGLELGVTAVAALLCACTVRQITRIQTAPSRLTQLTTAPAASTPPRRSPDPVLGSGGVLESGGLGGA